jgi:hypothetical protein
VKQREREKEALMAARAFIHAGESEQREMLKRFDAIMDGMVKNAQVTAERCARHHLDEA